MTEHIKVIDDLWDAIGDLKKEVQRWQRKYNQMADRNEGLQNQINDLRIRIEELECGNI